MPDAAAYSEHEARDASQWERVLAAMLPRAGAAFPGRWWAKDVLAHKVGGTPHAMSARFSDLRKRGYVVESLHVGGGLYLYRLAGSAVSGAGASG